MVMAMLSTTGFSTNWFHRPVKVTPEYLATSNSLRMVIFYVGVELVARRALRHPVASYNRILYEHGSSATLLFMGQTRRRLNISLQHFLYEWRRPTKATTEISTNWVVGFNLVHGPESRLKISLQETLYER
jgi:hypothetical protein